MLKLYNTDTNTTTTTTNNNNNNNNVDGRSCEAALLWREHLYLSGFALSLEQAYQMSRFSIFKFRDAHFAY